MYGDLPSGNGTGASSRRPPWRSAAGTGRTPHRSRDVPSRARTSDSMSKSAPVSSRCRCAVVDDREVQHVVGVAQRDVTEDLDPAGTALRGLPVGTHPVDAEQEVGGVRLGPEPVVRHGREGAVVVVDHGGEAGHDLTGERTGAAVGRGGRGARRRARLQVVGRQPGPGHQGGPDDGAVCLVTRRRHRRGRGGCGGRRGRQGQQGRHHGSDEGEGGCAEPRESHGAEQTPERYLWARPWADQEMTNL